jgi:ATP-binding cassette subfamily B protein
VKPTKPTDASKNSPPKPNIFGFLKKYLKQIIGLCILVTITSSLNLAFPKLISLTIDNFKRNQFNPTQILLELGFLSLAILITTTAQSIFAAYLSEKVAFDLRENIAEKLSAQTFDFVNQVSPSTILTNFTSDVDAMKGMVAQAIPTMFSSIILIVGSAAILLSINAPLALIVLAVVVILFLVFRQIFSKISVYFRRAQGVIDQLNRTINESIIASALIRVVNGQAEEIKKFQKSSNEAREINLTILSLFASLIPLITFLGNGAVLLILYFGGVKVINNNLSIGDFLAFFNYISLLIMPIVILGFISNIIVRASTSYGRISNVIFAKPAPATGDFRGKITGKIEFKKVSVKIGEKELLKDVSFTIHPNQKTALIGPTGGGKSLILYLMIGLMKPTSGEILLSGHPISDFDIKYLHEQMSLVFQDSFIFNGTILENLTFNESISQEKMDKALKTAALHEYIANLPDGVNHYLAERGSSLSGGQKQRLSLARALMLNPHILLLDDFTARVDLSTEKFILEELEKNYPLLTLISVSQKIASVENYDQLILVMEGELLAHGKHKELLETSFEYQQIYASQQTT